MRRRGSVRSIWRYVCTTTYMNAYINILALCGESSLGVCVNC